MENVRGLVQHDKCLLTELADGTGVLLHLETKFYYTLNAAGVEVWKAVGGGARTEREIAQHVSREFEVDEETALADVCRVLDTLLAEGLVRNSGVSG